MDRCVDTPFADMECCVGLPPGKFCRADDSHVLPTQRGMPCLDLQDLILHNIPGMRRWIGSRPTPTWSGAGTISLLLRAKPEIQAGWENRHLWLLPGGASH